MAISDVFNSLTFGEINSLDYGVYISGPGVYDAPTRDVELVNVPGRNGDIEIDKGHWSNITVTYRAGTFGDDQTDFASNINAFRNAIVSQIGYNRLTDTYNPSEYRLGIYMEGLDVAPVSRNRAGEFELKFNCKPQRYLLGGETELNVTSGETITNPTLLQSAPVIKLQGYGNVTINDDVITKKASPIGIVKVYSGGNYQGEASKTTSTATTGRAFFDVAELTDRTIINIDNYEWSLTINSPRFGSLKRVYPLVVVEAVEYQEGANPPWFGRSQSYTWGETSQDPNVIHYEVEFKGTTIKPAGGSVKPGFEMNVTATLVSCNDPNATITAEISTSDIYVYSRKETIDKEVVIDCESGISWMETEEGKVSTDNFLTLPPNLVRLDPGDNLVTFDNTIDYVKITPKWWEL